MALPVLDARGIDHVRLGLLTAATGDVFEISGNALSYVGIASA
jgi:hypothetical protein